MNQESLLSIYINKYTKPQPSKNTISDYPITSKVYTGDIDEMKKGKDRIIPKEPHEVQAFLKKNVPSAAPCSNKIKDSVLSDGICIIPKDEKKVRKSKSQFIRLEVAKQEFRLEDKTELFVENYLTFGDGYLYPVFDKSKETLMDIVTLDTQKIIIHVDKDSLLKYGVYIPVLYEYRITPPRGGNSNSAIGTDGGSVFYTPDELIRWKRPNIYDPVYGLGVLEEEQASLLFGIRVLNHNLKFFSNNGKPPLLLHLGEDITREKALEFKEYHSSNYKGANKAWDTMVTYGSVKAQELTLPDQTSFMDFLTYVRVQTCALYGVAPSEVGVVDKSGLNTAETSHKDFIKTNINRKKKQAGDILNYFLVNKMMKITDYQYNLPGMDTINEKQRVETNAIGLKTGQMTFNEMRKASKREPIKASWADEFVIGDPAKVGGYAYIDDVLENSKNNLLSQGGEEGGNPSSGRPDMDGRSQEPNAGPSGGKE